MRMENKKLGAPRLAEVGRVDPGSAFAAILSLMAKIEGTWNTFKYIL